MAYSPISHLLLPMNIMLNKIVTLIIIVIIFTVGTLQAQESKKNQLLLTAAAGISFNSIDNLRLPDDARLSGFGSSGALIWQPEYLLSVGFETGWLFMNKIERTNITTQFGSTSISSLWQAVPLLCIFGMKIHDNVSLYGGFGYYDIIAVNESFGTTVATSQMNAGLSGALDYHLNLNSQSAFGARFTLHNITELQQRLITLQFSYHYSLLAW